MSLMQKKRNKRDNEEYNKSMKRRSWYKPSQIRTAIEKGIVEKQSAEKNMVLTNATTSSTLAKKLAAEAINNAKEGKTDIALVE